MSDRGVILICGGTETLGYFSKQIAIALVDIGVPVFMWDMEHPTASIDAFAKLENKSDYTLVTFNFLGMNGESQFIEGISNIWDKYGIKKTVILVDSPIYYYTQLSMEDEGLKIICIDKNHSDFIAKWYPKFEKPAFIPLMGNLPVIDMWTGPGMLGEDKYFSNPAPLLGELKNAPLNKRPFDCVFIGNYVTVDSLMPSIENADEQYKDFLFSIAERLIKNPKLPVEDEIYNSLKEEFPDEEEPAYVDAMYHMIFVDLYVRTILRGNMVRTLVDAGYRIHLVGQDWDKLECRCPENIIRTQKMMDSASCLRALESSKISLNIMPGFKKGSHDRIFSSMLAGCAVLTDSSQMLDDIMSPWREYAPFVPGDDISLLGSMAKLSEDINLAQGIANKGRRLAQTSYTWKHFADELMVLL